MDLKINFLNAYSSCSKALKIFPMHQSSNAYAS